MYEILIRAKGASVANPQAICFGVILGLILSRSAGRNGEKRWDIPASVAAEPLELHNRFV